MRHEKNAADMRLTDDFFPAKVIINRRIIWTRIVLGVVTGIVFNNRGIPGWLPVVANLEYSLAVFRFKQVQSGMLSLQ